MKKFRKKLEELVSMGSSEEDDRYDRTNESKGEVEKPKGAESSISAAISKEEKDND